MGWARRKSVKNTQDGLVRCNYLFQAATNILVNQPENVELVRYYMKSLREIKEKKVIKCSIDIKHSICDRCNMLLIAGVTSKVRIRDNYRLVATCLSCNTIKRSNIHKPSSKTKEQKMKCLAARKKKVQRQRLKSKEKKTKDISKATATVDDINL